MLCAPLRANVIFPWLVPLRDQVASTFTSGATFFRMNGHFLLYRPGDLPQEGWTISVVLLCASTMTLLAVEIVASFRS